MTRRVETCGDVTRRTSGVRRRKEVTDRCTETDGVVQYADVVINKAKLERAIIGIISQNNVK